MEVGQGVKCALHGVLVLQDEAHDVAKVVGHTMGEHLPLLVTRLYERDPLSLVHKLIMLCNTHSSGKDIWHYVLGCSATQI